MRTMRWFVIGSLTAVVFGSLASQSRAIEDVYAIAARGGNNWGPTCCTVQIISPAPVASPISMFDGFGFVNGVVSAGDGALKGSLAGHFTAPALETRFFDPLLSALHSGPLIFSGPTPTIQTEGNLSIDGVISVETFPPAPNAFSVAQGNVTFRLTLNGVATQLRGAVEDDSTDEFSGILENQFTGLTIVPIETTLAIGGIAKTPAIMVPTGVEVLADFFMQLNFGHLSDGFPGFSDFEANFANTMSWARGRPVFDLPPGYTVNGMGIVDNMFVIPEPASGIAAVLAALLVSLLRRERN